MLVLLMALCAPYLLKASSLAVSKVRQFLHLKPSYTKFTLATHMDPAYVDKLAKGNNGVQNLLGRQDRTVDAKLMKTKDSKKTVRAVSTTITEKNRPKKVSLLRGQSLLERSEILEMLQENESSTMSETKAAFAERTIRSLKNFLHRYIEDYAYKYIHKLPQFVTTLNSGKKCSNDLKPEDVKNSDFLSILHSKPR